MEQTPSKESNRRRRWPWVAALGAAAIAVAVGLSGVHSTSTNNNTATPTHQAAPTGSINPAGPYPEHHVTATMFWVGEPADASNGYIANVASAWVQNWQKEFGGVNTPTTLCKQYFPCFTYHENPFYVALPFDDYQDNGDPKPSSVLKHIYWDPTGAPARPGSSLVKNRWVAITANGVTAYAQWEDVGPFHSNDVSYVFGNQPPEYHAGIDVSPAVDAYAHLNGEATVTWEFVPADQVPAGPWRQVVTSSGTNW